MEQATRGPGPSWRMAGEGRDSQESTLNSGLAGAEGTGWRIRPARGHSQLVGWPEHHIIECKWAGALSRILLPQLELCEILRLDSSS